MRILWPENQSCASAGYHLRDLIVYFEGSVISVYGNTLLWIVCIRIVFLLCDLVISDKGQLPYVLSCHGVRIRRGGLQFNKTANTGESAKEIRVKLELGHMYIY